MFDLIGFWAAVTLQTVVLVFPAVVLFAVITQHLADKIMGRFAPQRIAAIGYVFGKYIPGADTGAPYIIPIFALIGYTAVGIMEKTTYWQLVSNVASALAEPSGWIGIFVLGYFGVLYVGKKTYPLIEKLQRIKEKLDNE